MARSARCDTLRTKTCPWEPRYGATEAKPIEQGAGQPLRTSAILMWT